MSFVQTGGRAAPRVAFIWRGQPKTRERLQPLYTALANLGIDVEWAIYGEETHDQVREIAVRCDGALVWVDPISDGRDRTKLDALLHEASDQGVWVSAHPRIVQRMGTKEVLYTTRNLGWTSDIGFYRTAAQLSDELPGRIASSGPRVLKQRRGNGGIGTWKVQVLGGGVSKMTGAMRVRVEEARPGAPVEELWLAELLQRLAPHVLTGGVIDQRFEQRASEGMVRCYLIHDRVVGFSRQAPRRDGSFGHATEKAMYEASHMALSNLKKRMEQDWVPGMQRLLEIAALSLPVIWDADFLLGPKSAAGEDTYVLCEINVSSVSPFPEFAVPLMARTISARLHGLDDPSPPDDRRPA